MSDISETDADQKSKLEAATAALGDPVGISFHEETTKARRNLIVFSFIALFYEFSEAEISSVETFGLKFDEIRPEKLEMIYIILLVYAFINFLWKSADEFAAWRNRITGTRLSYSTGAKWGNAYCDYPDNPKHSSLSYWWIMNAQKIEDLPGCSKNIKSGSDELLERMQSINLSKSEEVKSLERQISAFQTMIARLEESVKSGIKVFGSARISVSLSRYECWCKALSWSTILRWVLLEYSFPIIMAVYAFIIMLAR